MQSKIQKDTKKIQNQDLKTRKDKDRGDHFEKIFFEAFCRGNHSFCTVTWFFGVCAAGCFCYTKVDGNGCNINNICHTDKQYCIIHDRTTYYRSFI